MGAVLRAADRVATPWKNGGGVTREVAAWPPGAGFDDFHWRVSMAEVRRDGPFSIFPNVDRILAVLEGRLALSVAGFNAFELGPDSPPAHFPGDAPTNGHVLQGPVLDLNVMVRRGAAEATLERIAVGPATALAPAARLILALGPLTVGASDATHSLARHDAYLATPDEALMLSATNPTHAYVAGF